MKNNLPKIFVVVLNFNGYKDTRNCIDSLKKVSYPNFEIVVVDNASEDNSVERLKDEFSDIEFIISNENLGYAGGMNMGAKFGLKNNADLVLLTNNDVVFTEKFFEPLLG